MHDVGTAIMVAVPMGAFFLAFGWAEVERLRSLRAMGIAAIEAEKAVKIAEATAKANAEPQPDPRPRGAAGEG